MTNNPHPISTKVGDRFPADHDYVRRWPFAFMNDALPDYVGRDVASKYLLSETMKRQAIAEKTEGKDRPREAPPKARTIPLENQVICIKHAGAFGASTPLLMKGSKTTH